jgi:riboflavin kinase / FMN adenylyltransferase
MRGARATQGGQGRPRGVTRARLAGARLNLPPILTSSTSWPADAPRTVVTVGNFDGVHLGHQALIDRTRALASAHGARAVAFTFDPAPRDVLRPGNAIPRIQRLSDRLDLLLACGVDHVVIEPFDLDYARRDAAWFAREVLGARLRATAVVVGWDFRFGKGRDGNVDTLRAELGAPVEQVAALELDGAVVSSSRVREALASGRVEDAALLLGRPHRVVGEVVPGSARGRQLGFPTANLEARTPLVPAPGVYAIRAIARGEHGLPGVANLGSRPTFGGGPPTLEVHLLGWSGDLYGVELGVDFVARLRDERRFPSADALREQIGADVRAAREALS